MFKPITQLLRYSSKQYYALVPQFVRLPEDQNVLSVTERLFLLKEYLIIVT